MYIHIIHYIIIILVIVVERCVPHLHSPHQCRVSCLSYYYIFFECGEPENNRSYTKNFFRYVVKVFWKFYNIQHVYQFKNELLWRWRTNILYIIYTTYSYQVHSWYDGYNNIVWTFLKLSINILNIVV